MMQTQSALLIFFLITLFGCTQQQSPAPTTSYAAQATHESTPAIETARNSAGFDFYLLNLSWSPEFCSTHPTATECAQHPAFVLHGLWPERTNGSYPENCSSTPGPINPSRYADIYPDAGLLKHEWRTHGTCSGLSPDAFFTAARTAFHSVIVPPKLAGLSAQISLPPSEIAALFEQSNPGLKPSSLAISCGNNYLTAVEVCLDKNLHGTACGTLKSCRATTVRIPNP